MLKRTLLLGLTLAVGCVGETPANPIAAPDLARLTVFFPIEGLVTGRGSPGAVPAGYRFVYIKPHPSRNVVSFTRVADDGSFKFQVAANGSDVLEIAFAETDNPTGKRGAPTFVEVPVPLARQEQFYCCKKPMGTSRCQPVRELVCTDSIVAPECTDDADCAFLSFEHIGLDRGDITVTPPGPDGRVTIRSADPRLALHLLKVENRGQRAVGGADRKFRAYVIADELGVAEVNIRAQGDDEIVTQVYALNGLVRSREHAVYVPDSPLTGLDVVGIFPFTPLAKETSGTIGIRFAPFGADGRGICPPSNEPGEVLCFSGGHEIISETDPAGRNENFNGGLDYDRIEITGVTIDGRMVPNLVKPTNVTGPLKFTDGDILAPAVSIVLIVDKSGTSDDDDGRRTRFKAAQSFVSSMRSRDRVALIATGALSGGVRDAMDFSVRTELGDRGAARAALDVLEPLESTGENDLYSAIHEAGRMLGAGGPNVNGRIVVISAAQQGARGKTASEVLDLITENPDTGRSAFPVYIVMSRIDPTAPDASEVATDFDTFAGFTGGAFIEVDDTTELLTSVATVTGRVSGAFVLTYPITIPVESGDKSARIRFTASIRLPNPAGGPDLTQSTTYEGDLELRLNQ